MVEAINTIFNFLAVWGFWLFAGVLLAAVVGLVRIGRRHRAWLPPTWGARAGMALLLLAAAASAGALLLLNGPLDELLDGMRRFRHVHGAEVANVEFRRVADDSEVDLHHFKGQVTLVNLWATWCPPCVEELPELDRLQRSYGDSGLAVVTLSQEERQRLLDFEAEHDYCMENVYAEEIDWLDVGPNRPISLVLDRQGRLRDYVVGARDFEGFEKMVRPYLEAESTL